MHDFSFSGNIMILDGSWVILMICIDFLYCIVIGIIWVPSWFLDNIKKVQVILQIQHIHSVSFISTHDS